MKTFRHRQEFLESDYRVGFLYDRYSPKLILIAKTKVELEELVKNFSQQLEFHVKEKGLAETPLEKTFCGETRRACRCGRGYASQYDGKCGHCRSSKEQKAYDRSHQVRFSSLSIKGGEINEQPRT